MAWVLRGRFALVATGHAASVSAGQIYNQERWSGDLRTTTCYSAIKDLFITKTTDLGLMLVTKVTAFPLHISRLTISCSEVIAQ